MPVDVALPFWWLGESARSGPLLERLATLVEGVTIMNYRTDASLIRRSAQPFLEWGARHGRQVRIALESGPIPDEALRHYRPADEGDAALLALGPDGILVQLAQARASERPMDRMFAFSHETTSRGADVTFAGRREALIQLLPEQERLWNAWPAFAGVALHGFEP